MNDRSCLTRDVYPGKRNALERFASELDAQRSKGRLIAELL